jgi:RecB family endonuclease NucS
MRESAIQKKIIDDLTRCWYTPVKTIKTNIVGIADIIALHPTRPAILVEVKQEKGRESEIQRYRRETFTEKWMVWIVAYWYEDYMEKIWLYERK